MSKYNEAQKNAIMKYMKNNVDKLTLALPKGTKNRWNAAAQLAGMSLTRYLTHLVNEDAKRNGLDKVEDHSTDTPQVEE